MQVGVGDVVVVVVIVGAFGAATALVDGNNICGCVPRRKRWSGTRGANEHKLTLTRVLLDRPASKILFCSSKVKLV